MLQCQKVRVVLFFWTRMLQLMINETIQKKKRLCEEIERVFDKFLTHYMDSLLWNLNTDVGMEDIFKPTTGNES
jgi:hypothetical protein